MRRWVHGYAQAHSSACLWFYSVLNPWLLSSEDEKTFLGKEKKITNRNSKIYGCNFPFKYCPEALWLYNPEAMIISYVECNGSMVEQDKSDGSENLGKFSRCRMILSARMFVCFYREDHLRQNVWMKINSKIITPQVLFNRKKLKRTARKNPNFLTDCALIVYYLLA